LSSRVRTFVDPDEYTEYFRGGRAELTITGRGKFAAKIVSIDLHHMGLQRFSDDLPRIAYAVEYPDQSAISFRTEPGPALLRSGAEMLPTTIVRRATADSFFQRSEGIARFATIRLPLEEIVSLGATLAGCDLTPPKDTFVVSPPSFAMKTLQHLHATAGRLAEYAPAVLAVPEAAQGLEQALLEAVVRCLNTGKAGADRSALRQHALIMRRFHRMVEENADQALFIPQVCRAIGTSERTLRVCCEEQLGVSPKRYLLTRRMHLVRRALWEGAATTKTVTEVATRYGFWELGRFAGEYKSLFGESPSAALARPPEERRS